MERTYLGDGVYAVLTDDGTIKLMTSGNVIYLDSGTFENLKKFVHEEMKNCTIVYDTVHYRPAGFRAPKKGECYVNKAGHVCVCQQNFEPGVKRLIVRAKTIEELEEV